MGNRLYCDAGRYITVHVHFRYEIDLGIHPSVSPVGRSAADIVSIVSRLLVQFGISGLGVRIAVPVPGIGFDPINLPVRIFAGVLDIVVCYAPDMSPILPYTSPLLPLHHIVHLSRVVLANPELNSSKSSPPTSSAAVLVIA